MVGAVVAAAFAIVGVTRLLPTTVEVTIGARLLLMPAAAVLWPLVLVRWLGRRGGTNDT